MDAITSEPLIGAKVHLPQSKNTAAADAVGEFEIGPVQESIIQVDIDYIGYEPSHYIIGFSRFDTEEKLSAKLLPECRELQSVTIVADRVDENVTAKITGVETLSITLLKTLPAFMGEVDPIRSLTTIPGVNTIGELASGFNVRR